MGFGVIFLQISLAVAPSIPGQDHRRLPISKTSTVFLRSYLAVVWEHVIRMQATIIHIRGPSSALV
jgi:hypothetical protein